MSPLAFPKGAEWMIPEPGVYFNLLKRKRKYMRSTLRGQGKREEGGRAGKCLAQGDADAIFPKSNIEEAQVRNFLKVMKALSDPNRVKIVKMLQHKRMCVCELQAALEVARPLSPST